MKTSWTVRVSAALLAAAATLASLSALDWVAQWQGAAPSTLARAAAGGKAG